MLGSRVAPLAKACRSLSTTAKVWVDKNTKVICQGFTGKQVRDCPTPALQPRALASSGAEGQGVPRVGRKAPIVAVVHVCAGAAMGALAPLPTLRAPSTNGWTCHANSAWGSGGSACTAVVRQFFFGDCVRGGCFGHFDAWC